ncbi:beta-ketoacyl-[acyl-carrier-protein] synthase family protein [Granulicella tundricola]|uniref:Nodulation protein E n=1 Tax=Granulicella tundricola (strain ATCC BAA-1859 / DSM 23138 / MP5ACTX9) TaxID=1198114 RepID=E8X5K9_GRATM|nr:beta-ketoacyl-[acyl-carrier-protein] synthase family protein [Granulicella tundricola]ADW70636.1 Beta-ketoacyl synthase [Granulicella tundricola MP5ACTX9]
MRRVCITGVGVISSLGNDRAEFWDGLTSGVAAIGPKLGMDMEQFRFKNVAAANGYKPEANFEAKELALLDRFAQFALVAADEAVKQAGVEWTEALREDTAVVTGSCLGGRGAEEVGYWELFHNNKNRVHPLTIPLSMSNAGASHISMKYGTRGAAYTISTACSSSAHAIGQAFWMVRSGAAPMAITGGSEAPLFLGSLKAWEAMRVISKDTCRPFSADRTGLILGEGGAMLVLEPLDDALARGAKPLAEIVGFGMTSDAAHLTNPSGDGATSAMRKAIKDSGLALEQFGYINAHGTATQANDSVESAAIRTVFGKQAVAVSSTKSMHGHTLGAAGALEAVASVMALQCGVLPPTANYTTPDPECELDVIPNEARAVRVEACLSNSFAFGGLNAVLAFKAI